MQVSRLYCCFCALALCLVFPYKAFASITTTGNVTPDPATTTLSSTLYIGQSGTGTMLANAGSDVVAGLGYIGYLPGSNGTATIDGAGSTWTTGGGLIFVGKQGTGTLNITSGGVVTANIPYVGSQPGSSGSVSIDGAGSLLTMTNFLQVGYQGNGTLKITNGGQLKNTGSNSSGIGTQGGIGAVTIDGAGSKWTSSTDLEIGGSGSGSLAITNGGSASGLGVAIGRQSTATVDGPGSSWSISTLLVGVGGSSAAITNGAQLNVQRGVSIAPDSNSPLTITDSQATVGGLTLPANSNGYDVTLTNSTFSTTDVIGHLEEIGGVATFGAHGLVTNGDFVFDQANGLQRQFVVNGDTGQNITINLNVDGTGVLGAGYDAAGSLTIAGGRAMTSTYGYLGYEQMGNGIGTVDGAGTSWNITNELDVGYSGQGSLSITGGAHVTDVRGQVGSAYGSSSHPGTVIVSGAGSTWNNTFSFYITQGSLQILNGAHVTSPGASVGKVLVGNGASVTVDGVGSTWNNSGELRIGEGTPSSMSITNGAVVTSTSGVVGFESSGTVIVDGTGSAWTSTGDLQIGNSASGYVGGLQITNGAHVSSRAGSLGYSSGGIGNVTVDGPDSTWTMTDSLTLAFSSSLSILNGAHVSSVISTSVGKNLYGTGRIIFDHGVLTTGTFYAGADELQGTGDIYANGLVTDGDVVLSKAGGTWQPFKVSGQTDHDVTFHFTSDSLAMLGAGYDGVGSLTIAGGLAVISTSTDVGHFAGSNGTVHLTGPGTSWTTYQDFIVGASGTGNIEVTGGATASDTNGNIGSLNGSVGNVLVSGVGSQWKDSFGMFVGNGGTGNLNVSAGGSVTSPAAIMGASSSAVGTATIDGPGSKWSIAQNLTIGNSGTGTLSVVNGGIADINGNVTLGNASGSKGTVNLAGGTLRLHGGTLSKGSGTAGVNFTDGRLEGVGTINLGATFVQSGGTLAPGNTVGTTNITGGYTMDSGKLEIDLATLTTRDTVAVTGVVDLLGANGHNDGVLSVVFGYQPSFGATYLILTNDGTDPIVGTFANGSTLRTAYEGLIYTLGINYAAGAGGNDIILSMQSISGVQGDYNGDGLVNTNDYVAWRDTLNTTVLPYFGADGNGDGIVNDADYQVWRANFGRTASNGAGASVYTPLPEPPTLALLMLALAYISAQLRWASLRSPKDLRQPA